MSTCPRWFILQHHTGHSAGQPGQWETIGRFLPILFCFKRFLRSPLRPRPAGHHFPSWAASGAENICPRPVPVPRGPEDTLAIVPVSGDSGHGHNVGTWPRLTRSGQWSPDTSPGVVTPHACSRVNYGLLLVMQEADTCSHLTRLTSPCTEMWNTDSWFPHAVCCRLHSDIKFGFACI